MPTTIDAVRRALDLALQAWSVDDHLSPDKEYLETRDALDALEEREAALEGLVERWRRLAAQEGDEGAQVAYRACAEALQRVVAMPMPDENAQEVDDEEAYDPTG